jgi:endoglucanase
MHGRQLSLSALRLSLFCALIIGSCAKGTTSGTPDTCGAGLDSCNNQCVDLKSDSSHCGACGTACGAGRTCSNGVCGCLSSQTLCGSTCVDTQTDVVHCGGCTATACPSGNFCMAGHCSATCTLTTCGAGQCVDTQTNSAACGSCGHVCPSNLPACISGVCSCPAGQTLCATSNTCTAPSACATGGGVGGTTGGGTAGTNGGTAGTTGGGVGGTSGGMGGAGGSTRACAPTTVAPTGLASIDVISDFEEGNPPAGPGAVLIKQGTPQRTGWWYVYSDPTAGGVQTPAISGGPIAAVEASGDTNMCNKGSFHSTATGHPQYVGFGATFLPAAPPSTAKSAYPVDSYDGITFKMKSGGGTNPPLFFQVLTKETQPVASGGIIPPTATGGTTYSNAHIGTDLYNSRGILLNKATSSWEPLVSTTYQTYYVPFAMLYPQWVPAPGGANGGCALAPAAGDPKCQAPSWVPASALSFQLSVLSDFAMTAGTYNLWLDDVMFYKRAATGQPVDLPAPPSTAGAMHPFPQNLSVGANCRKPVGAAVDGKFLVSAYNQWKTRFVVAGGGGLRVQRPEVNNDTVSEGIAYGMLIGVYMNDKALFDGLWTYWKANPATTDGPLMTWQIPGGQGTATDADEDAAFAMLMASRQWGGSPAGDGATYAANALNLMHAVLAHDMAAPYIKGGSNYAANGITNPSYFAPAWYRVFATADAGNAATWNGIASNVYTLLGNISGSSANGLFAAWCANNCASITSNTGSQNPAQDVLYQYDSHRIPMRVGLDYCWNGGTAASGILNKNVGFFSGKAAAGIGRVLDIYTPGGGDVAGSAPNSASIIGTSAVGAMSSASFQTYLNDAYQAIFDMSNKATLAPIDTMGRTPYSYYNATVGMLTLLMMTGNFTVF